MKVKVNGQILKVSAIVREKDGSLVAYRNKKIVASVSNPKDMEIIVNVREL
jgi:ribosomal 50S subunit-recycling heat shock protein